MSETDYYRVGRAVLLRNAPKTLQVRGRVPLKDGIDGPEIGYVDDFQIEENGDLTGEIHLTNEPSNTAKA